MDINARHIVIQLNYDERNKEFCQQIEFGGDTIIFSIDELSSDEEDAANATANRMWRWLTNNLDAVKCFAANAIWNKYKKVPCTAKTPQELAVNLPMPCKVNVGIHNMSEIIFDDAILDSIFCGSSYEIVVRIDTFWQMKDVFLFKYS